MDHYGTTMYELVWRQIVTLINANKLNCGNPDVRERAREERRRGVQASGRGQRQVRRAAGQGQRQTLHPGRSETKTVVV